MKFFKHTIKIEDTEFYLRLLLERIHSKDLELENYKPRFLFVYPVYRYQFVDLNIQSDHRADSDFTYFPLN